jgi:hypothetical protein
MILQLSLFQVFFMALSIVGLSFSILYLFIGGPTYENTKETYTDREVSRENVVDIHSNKRRSSRPPQQQQRPPPHYRTSVGRQARVAHPNMRVLEVDYKVINKRGAWEEVTINTISQITESLVTATGKHSA